jgi:trehalose synthase
MWKGTPVVGGNVGGIRHQIIDGVNGFLVASVEEAAQRMVKLLRDDDLRREMGSRARETVREQFLMTALLERYLDLFNAFEPDFRLRELGS